MKIRLLRDSRINHAAGEIVEVSSATAEFLLSVGSAVIAEQKAETATIKVEEVAEKAVKAPKAATKTTATKRTATKK